MAEWRLGYGWSEQELQSRLERARTRGFNFPETGPQSQEGNNWHRYYSEAIIAREKPGPPEDGGAYAQARRAVAEYQFSDPGIVTAHFSPRDPLKGRTVLLELKVMALHYLCGARITDVRDVTDDSETQFGFRYDTLEDHLEVGSEWFLLTKKHQSGEVWFRISASWRPGDFPNWWSRVGFAALGRRYQLAWHRLAYLRLREIAHSGDENLAPVPSGEALVHTGGEIAESKTWILNRSSAEQRIQHASNAEHAKPSSEVETGSRIY